MEGIQENVTQVGLLFFKKSFVGARIEYEDMGPVFIEASAVATSSEAGFSGQAIETLWHVRECRRVCYRMYEIKAVLKTAPRVGGQLQVAACVVSDSDLLRELYVFAKGSPTIPFTERVDFRRPASDEQ